MAENGWRTKWLSDSAFVGMTKISIRGSCHHILVHRSILYAVASLFKSNALLCIAVVHMSAWVL